MIQDRSSNIIQLKDIIDAPLAQLLEWRRLELVDSKSDVFCYMIILINYLQGDLPALQNASASCPNKSVWETLSRMRVDIRSRTITIARLELYLAKLVERTSDPLILGEGYFILGYSCYSIHEHGRAIEFYRLAIPLLERGGALKKALKAQQNVLACETCQNPLFKAIPAYHALYLRALEIDDHVSAALCFMNISREYQKLGAINSAITAINHTIDLLAKDFGVIHFYLALAHRAHLLIQLGFHQAAFSDIEKCMTCDFPEAREAVLVLEKIDRIDSRPPNKEVLNPTWRARAENFYAELNKPVKFHELEEKVLFALRRGPLNKHDLITELYGEKISFESADNRFKNLLARIRKKSPHLLKFENGQYSIQDVYRREA
jgi:tetratricopeptide (TPR) repeat protein